MHISNEQKDRHVNDWLKLATDAKLTVSGNEFHHSDRKKYSDAL